MTKQRWMAVIGIVLSALCSWALRRWASNGDVHALVDLVRDVLPIFGLTFAGIGIVGGKSPTEEPKAITKVVLPFLFVGALLSSGCGTAGGKAFTACELGKLPAEGQTAWATVQDIVSSPSSAKEDLIAAGLTMLPGQLDCAARAVLAWLESLADKPAVEGAPVARALVAASTASAHDHAREVLRAYLAGRATSCRPVRVAMVEPCEDNELCRPIVVDRGVPEDIR